MPDGSVLVGLRVAAALAGLVIGAVIGVVRWLTPRARRSDPSPPSGGSVAAASEEGFWMTTTQGLRPVERRVLRLVDQGLDDAEIGRRFGRTERWTAQVRFLADLDVPRSQATDSAIESDTERLRPLERRLLRWRAQGLDHDDLADRFRHSAEHLARVEEYAHYKLAAAS